MPEGTPYVLTNDPNPSLRAYHKPEGTPYVFENHPTPNIKEKKHRNKKKKHLQNNTENDENKRNCEDRNKQDKEEKRHDIKHEKRELSAEQQGDLETSCPAAMRQRKSWVEGDGRWVWNNEWHAQSHKTIRGHILQERDGKLALAQDRAPSRGEPGEPRGLTSFQRTPRPKLGGKDTKPEAEKSKEKGTQGEE